ncbi:50S ribosomal protein L9 [compost metagenome]
MDIAAAMVKAGFATIEKSQVRLPDGALKAVGEYPVQVALHADVVVDITVVVQGEMA